MGFEPCRTSLSRQATARPTRCSGFGVRSARRGSTGPAPRRRGLRFWVCRPLPSPSSSTPRGRPRWSPWPGPSRRSASSCARRSRPDAATCPPAATCCGRSSARWTTCGCSSWARTPTRRRGTPSGCRSRWRPTCSRSRAAWSTSTRSCRPTSGSRARSTGDLSPWADQGVLLLNRVLTVRPGKPASHRGKGWETVTAQAIAALVSRGGPLVAILWGRDARNLVPHLAGIPAIESAHPSPLSAHSGFFGSRPFSRANELLAQQGAAPDRLEAPVTDRRDTPRTTRPTCPSAARSGTATSRSATRSPRACRTPTPTRANSYVGLGRPAGRPPRRHRPPGRRRLRLRQPRGARPAAGRRHRAAARRRDRARPGPRLDGGRRQRHPAPQGRPRRDRLPARGRRRAAARGRRRRAAGDADRPGGRAGAARTCAAGTRSTRPTCSASPSSTAPTSSTSGA